MYDESIAQTHDYRPLPEAFEIKESSIEGKGLFVKEGYTVPKGIVTSDKTWILPLEEKEQNPWGESLTLQAPEPTHIEVKTPDGGYELFRTPFGGFINHSDNPNCEIEKAPSEELLGYNFYLLVALRDLQGGEEVTVCYGQAKICSK